MTSILLLRLSVLACQVNMVQELRENWSVVRKIDQIVRIIHFLFKGVREIIIVLDIEQDPVRPRWVPLQPESQIVVGLALESGRKGYLAFLEQSWDVPEGTLYIQLITLKEQVVPVLLYSLGNRLLEAIDAIVHVTE